MPAGRIYLFLTALSGRFKALPGAVRAGIWISGSAVAYAVMIFYGRYLAPEIPIFEIAFLRNAFAILFMMPWLRKVGISGMRTQHVGRHLLRGAISSVNVTCLFAAVSFLPIADASAINFMQPVIATAIACLFLGEVASLRRWMAIGLGFVGALLVIRPGFEAFNIGIAFALGSAMAGALVSIMIKTLVRTDPPDTIAAWLFVTQTLILMIPTLFVWVTPTWNQWLIFALLGIISVLLQRTYNRGIQAADISISMPFNFTRLIWAALLGWLAFGEFPDIWTWMGGAVIFFASIWLTRLGKS
ncbi:MAG: EamA family transporter [Rhodospirillaceae bacterium]